jgi:hypothetical protein
MIKTFDTSAVLATYSGRVLKDFSEIHHLLDHLYPGIMTLGCAMVLPEARATIERQHPGINEIDRPADWTDAEQRLDYLRRAESVFGATMALDNGENADAFNGLLFELESLDGLGKGHDQIMVVKVP